MAKPGGTASGTKKGARKSAAPRTGAPSRPKTGRPPRLAHLVPGSDRQLKRERALQASGVQMPAAVPPRPAWPAPAPDAPLQGDGHSDVLCLPNPEWLPHVLTGTGPLDDLSAFRRAAAGPGIIPWATDYDRLEEDWVHALLTPPPAERGISVAGARILAGQLREQVEQQDRRATEAAGNTDRPLDLHALAPVPARILRLGPDAPAAVAWLWEHWTTTWALRGVEEVPADPHAPLPDGHGRLCYRFWSADWTPWRALCSARSRWPSISIQVSVRAIAE